MSNYYNKKGLVALSDIECTVVDRYDWEDGCALVYLSEVKKAEVFTVRQELERLYEEDEIFNHLILKQNDKGEYVFSLENLSEEEKAYVHSHWCNAR